MENNDLVKNIEDQNYGNLPLIQSQTKNTLTFVNFDQLKDKKDGDQVLIRARVHNIRGKGNSAFLILRERIQTVQAVIFKGKDTPKPMIKFVQKIPNESIVDIFGKVSFPQKPIESCTFQDRELLIEKCYVVSRSNNVLPFQMEDAQKNEHKETEGIVSLKTRLDNRVMDLRTPASQAIFRIQSGICQLFREYLLSQKFIEIHSPKMIGGSSEGGCEVFKTDYFGKEACLAQSPQLYKQMMIMADFQRVFEIGPVFRAENSNTDRHLCEFVGLDGEMEIKEHYSEVLEVIGLKEKFADEIKVIENQYEYEDFLFLEEPLMLTFEEGVNLLKEAGIEQDLHDDLNTTNEKALGKIVREKYKTDFYILHRYPQEARPFYTMLCKDDPQFTCSYDVFMRGQEIISGAQRIHDTEFLKERAIAKGLQVETIKDYLESFSLGAYPHGGFGIGMERVTMLFLNMYNVRKVSLFPRDPQRIAP